MLRTNIYLTTEQHKKLLKLSEQTALSQAALIRKAIDSFLAFAEGQSWESFLKPQYTARSTKRKR